MVELSYIYDDITVCGARIYFYDIAFAEAATVKLNETGRYAIFLDKHSIRTVTDLKYKLAHECGHCATETVNKPSSPFQRIEKNEYKANKWAFEKYLPIEEFAKAFSEGYRTTWELAEWFDMPEPFVQKAVQYYKENKGIDFDKLLEQIQ